MLIFIGFIDYFKLTFFSIIILKTLCFAALCVFLDVIAPKYCNIRFHEKIDEINKLSMNVIVTIFINYCIFVLCSWLTINGSNYTTICFTDVLINITYSIPLSLLSSIIFYYVHRSLHNKYLYGMIHKQHHIYNHPSSFVGLYTSISEFILSTCTSFFIPHLIINPHPYFVFGYTFIGLCDVFINHTSFQFNNNILNVLFGGSYFHYIHHAKFKYNYGLNNKIFDNLHNTSNIDNCEIY